MDLETTTIMVVTIIATMVAIIIVTTVVVAVIHVVTLVVVHVLHAVAVMMADAECAVLAKTVKNAEKLTKNIKRDFVDVSVKNLAAVAAIVTHVVVHKETTAKTMGFSEMDSAEDGSYGLSLFSSSYLEAA